MQILKNAKPNESHIITLKFVVKIKENKIATNVQYFLILC